ncbi:hypothetical protein B9Z55_028351 [Caenorhabditis nigoni]|uniref:Uncharacterized protein n=1 Tax=Caenorhabditis nigoni TaxID=1611254 RepID=A0A2G5SC02_9PELO|nr:hypothetical protein B9Z55_028351 [Caenorhabditis nigoni]
MKIKTNQQIVSVVLDEIPQVIKDDKENRDYLTTAMHNHNPHAASTMKESEYRFTIQFICSQASRLDLFGHTKMTRSAKKSPLKLFCSF